MGEVCFVDEGGRGKVETRGWSIRQSSGGIRDER